MTELRPGRAKPVLDRRLRMVRLARDLGNYLEGWKKKYESYIKGLFDAQKADSYQGTGISATYKSTPRRSLDPLAVVKDYPLGDLAERGLVSIEISGFLEAYRLTEDDLEPYLTGEGTSKRLDIRVEPPATGKLKRQLGSFMRNFEAKKKKRR